MEYLKQFSVLVTISALLFLTIVAHAAGQRFEIVELDEGAGPQVVIEDFQTALAWARQEDLSPTVSWQAALALCQGLAFGGEDDWRLPNVMELSSLIDETSSPAVNSTVFPHGFEAGSFWTSTTFVTNPSQAFALSFSDTMDEYGLGGVRSMPKTSLNRAICVRNINI